MPVLDFPASPLIGDKYPVPAVVGQPQYTFDGTKWTTVGAQVTTAAPASALPLMDQFTALVGTTTKYAREDHVHPINTSLLVKKNYVLNGAMMVSQENGAAAGTTNGYFPVDQWFINSQSLTTGAFSVAQVASITPAGSPNRVRVTVTAAQPTIGSSALLFIQRIEGLRWADLMWGTAAAKTVTVQLGVRSSVAGNFAVNLLNSDGSSTAQGAFTVAAGEINTDVVKSVTLTGMTSGTWLKDNGIGTHLYVVMAISGQANILATNGNVFEMFDVSLTEGTTAPQFVVPHYADALWECQRYYEIITHYPFGSLTMAYGESAGQAYGFLWYNRAKRASPSVITSAFGAFSLRINYTQSMATAVSVPEASAQHMLLAITAPVAVAGGAYLVIMDPASLIRVNARL